jgi:hypothetical protein
LPSRPRKKRLATPIAGDAAGATHRSTPPAHAAVGTINGVLQFLLEPANRYCPSVHHFSAALRRGHANMVDG